jgi:hypothetical protein
VSNTLSCNALNCVHNTSGLCSANKILVDGMSASTSNETNCHTFAEKGLKNALTNMLNMNVAGEMRQIFNKSSISMSPEIACEATKCVYNMDKVCSAQNVQIIGSSANTSDDTKCETFRE